MAGNTRRRSKTATGPAVLAAASPPATKYDCAVCHKTKPILGTNNAETFLMAPNGGRICLGCIADGVLADLAQGRVSMGLEYQNAGKAPGLYAVAPGGKLRLPLIRLPGWSDGQVVANPSFLYEGIVWSGRLYKTGMVAFQKTTVATTAPPRPAKKPRGRKAKTAATAAI